MSNVIVTLEIFLFCLGGVLFVYNSSRRVSEALSLGLVIALMLFSVIFQVSFLLKVPSIAFLFEGFFTFVFLRLILKKYSELKFIILQIKKFFLADKILNSIIFICWLYLFLLAVIIPPSNWDSMTYNLARVFLFQQEKSLFLENVTTYRQSMFVSGADILSHAFLRFYSDYGVGLFSFLAYISIGLGTYALSRNFASVKISSLATLVIIGMPEFCFQATSTKNDIFTSAAAVFCFITAYRLSKKLTIQDLSFIILGLYFGASVKTTFLPFLLPFVVFFGYLIIKQQGLYRVLIIIKKNWIYIVILTLLALFVSQFWLLFYNLVTQSDLTGFGNNTFIQPKNLLGIIANLVRYTFQSFHLFPFDYIAQARLNIPVETIIENLYNLIFKPFFGDEKMGYYRGYPREFSITLTPLEDFSWYGIGGFFLVIPSLFFALFKGNFFLRAMSLTQIGFLFIVSYTLSWGPWNNRYFSLFFTASGACIAFFIDSILRKNYNNLLIKGLIILFSFVLISSCIFNSSKPLGGLSIKEFFKPNIWIKTNLGSDRLYYARKYYNDERVEKFKELVPEKSKVALVAEDNSWIYHFYLTNPQTYIEPTNFSELKENAALYDYLLCLDVKCDPSQMGVPYQILWNSSEKSFRAGQLIKLIEN